MDDLVERLRIGNRLLPLPVLIEAADRIEALQAEVARLHMLAKANNNLAKHNGDAFKNERMTSALLADALDKIAEATSAEPDAGENYRWDDREGALDYAYATARQALKGTNNAA